MKDSFVSVRMDENHPDWEQCIKRENSLYERGNGIRSEFERDYTRILHSESYRRLKYKTQVFFAPQNDHICTRIEHVGHVASVSRTIARHLGLNQELTEAIALGHDIGHAPFGHTGENILNSLMSISMSQNEGHNAPRKFWHERNSLFFADFIDTLADPDGNEKNLDLTYAVRDGLIDDMMSQISAESNLNEEVSASFKEFMIAALAKAKYTVGEATATDDGGYDVTVSIEPLQIFAGVGEDINKTLEEKISTDSNEIMAMTEEEQTNYVMAVLIELLNKNLEDPEYDPAEEVTVHYGPVEGESGAYGCTEAEGEKLGSKLFSNKGL